MALPGPVRVFGLVLVVLLVVLLLLGSGPADASPSGACTGTGSIVGPSTSVSGQTWVTDGAESYNQQTAAADAFAATRGCTRTDIYGRQSPVVGFVLGSCSDAGHDGAYTWTDTANPCDMSLVGGDPEEPVGFDPTNVAHLLQALVVLALLGAFFHGLGFGSRVSF